MPVVHLHLRQSKYIKTNPCIVYCHIHEYIFLSRKSAMTQVIENFKQIIENRIVGKSDIVIGLNM